MSSRRDDYLDAMLRNLGAAYYETLHGQAAASDVARAVDVVSEAEAGHDGKTHPGQATAGTGQGAHRQARWRVRDVMTSDVATASMDMPCKKVARLLADRRLSAVPVLAADGHVLGMVSEADVLRKEESKFWRLGARLAPSRRRARAQAKARTAGGLMTSPAITIGPDAPVGAAARLMNAHRIRRLPVVDDSGRLIGIVSRRDVMKIFLRPDEEIAAEITGVLADILLQDAAGVTVSVRDGVVALAGGLPREDLIQVAIQLSRDVTGVVGVTSHLLVRQAPTKSA